MKNWRKVVGVGDGMGLKWEIQFNIVKSRCPAKRAVSKWLFWVGKMRGSIGSKCLMEPQFEGCITSGINFL